MRKHDPKRVPKLCGADVELGNFILGADHPYDTAAEASRTLLAAISALAVPARRPVPGSIRASSNAEFASSQDWGRKFLAAGQSFYIDLSHLECCTAEVLSGWDHVACWHATLRIVRQALADANARRTDPGTIQALVNNSDGRGHSYGSHLSFLITRRAWENLFQRKMHYLLYLAAFQASAIVYTGAGKVGSENGAPFAPFQLSQRADFFETLVGEQTTYRRPLVNSRDEALCGSLADGTSDMARLHCIFFDNTLCHGSTLLKVGVMQLVLLLVESERINPDLILDDPLAAVRRWSHDPTLRARARLASGKHFTAIELQLRFAEEAERFVASGACAGLVPRAKEILELWIDTLQKLRANDLVALAGRLDWILKFVTLQRALLRQPSLTWTSPQIKHLDFLYSSLGPDGVYWSYEETGVVERVVSSERIDEFTRTPPAETRAWTRGMLITRGSEQISEIDWDVVRFRLARPGGWPVYRSFHLANPLRFGKTETEWAFTRAETLEALLDLLGATRGSIDATPTLYDWPKEIH